MSVSYPLGSKPHIQWNHIDGPVFWGKDGYFHWLTIWERLVFNIGRMNIKDLEQKYNYSKFEKVEL